MSHAPDGKLILVINCGSSSLKYEVIRMPHRQSLGKGSVERIGGPVGVLTQSVDGAEFVIETPIPDHRVAMDLVGKALTDARAAMVSDLSEIGAVGHRVVHGGEAFSASVEIDAEVIKAIEDNIPLAPLHNPANLTGIHEAERLLPGIRQVAVFDTAFHQTMSPTAYLYGLPREFYEQHRIRRYGFHGTSHRYVAGRALELMRRFPDNTNLITCHLGNGASITAIENGHSMDTSMGFTPLEGLVMGTRSGNLDPAILLYLMNLGYTAEQLNDILNKKSGLLGLSGLSNDMRDLEKAAAEGHVHAQEALDVFASRVRKFIGGFCANLVKVDGLVFTGGIGQHGVATRARVCKRLEHLGIVLDYELNQSNGSKEGIISRSYSRTTILVIPTNEELQIAMDAFQLLFPQPVYPRRRASDVNLL